MKFKLSITTFDMVGGIHNYGSVYKNGVKIYECERNDPTGAPKWYTEEDEKEQPWMTIKFPTALEVVWAAKKWFNTTTEVQPGDKLIVWGGYFNRNEIREIKLDNCAV